MSTHETELPFANRLSDITSEILSEVNPDRKDYLTPKVDRFAYSVSTEHIRGESGGNRSHKAETYVNTFGDDALDVIAIVLKERDTFDTWPDPDKRYLLDLALGKKILSVETGLLRAKARQAYYGEADAGITETTLTIQKLKGRQARLKERATPSSPPMRR